MRASSVGDDRSLAFATPAADSSRPPFVLASRFNHSLRKFLGC